MNPDVGEWLHLALRWVHVIAGIMWIGSSIFFNWLDSHLEKPPPGSKPVEGLEGELWMVHSGGFYEVEKKLVAPAELPQTLHWFKWEAAFTWISGFSLLVLLYYMGGGMLLVDPAVSSISVNKATLLGLGTLVGAWILYDTMWNSSFGAAGPAPALVSFAGVVGVAYGLSHVLSGRAAYMHVGAMLGTLMVANVWMRIIPAQRALVEAVKAGRKPDPEMARRAKMRSRHNNYMTYPVLFIMVSNHFPATYGSKLGWVLLAVFFLVGASIRHYQNVGDRSPKVLLAAIALAFGLAFVVSMKRPAAPEGSVTAAPGEPPKTGGGVGSAQVAAMNLDPATMGSIKGRMRFSGTPPAPKEVTIPASCEHKGAAHAADAVLVAEGGLQNVFVWIKDGLPTWTAPPPKEEVVLDQRGCVYGPHVVGAQVGQTITFLNSDPVMHNVHGGGEANASFNAGMPGKGQRLSRAFDTPEVMVHMKCDVHPWMSAWIGVVPHPYYAVSGAKGEWSLSNVPPGEYTLEAWHETYGKQTRKVSLPAKGVVDAELTFVAQ